MGEPTLVSDLCCRVHVALKIDAVQAAGPIANAISVRIFFAITSAITYGIEVSAWLGRIGGIITRFKIAAKVLRIPDPIRIRIGVSENAEQIKQV